MILRGNQAKNPPGFPMHPIRRLTVPEQTADHLRAGLRAGRWGGRLPGVLRLAAELEVSKDAVRTALRRLEEEGVVTPGGNGRQRLFTGSRASPHGARKSLRVGILLSRPLRTDNGVSQRMLLRLLHEIENAGHSGFFASQSQQCLQHKLVRVVAMMQKTQADAWVVTDAPEELMQWLAAQTQPAICLGGRYTELPLARVAMDLTAGFLDAVRALKRLGHRRIVLTVPRVWRHPAAGKLVSAVLEELGGSPEYHVPDWDPGAQGFNDLLESLFRMTPPTAMIVVEPSEAIAVISFLAQRGLSVPQDLSLVCRHRDASLDLCRPDIACISNNEEHLVRHTLRWVNAVARGVVHHRRIVCQPEFIPGGSLAPPPGRLANHSTQSRT